MSRTRVYIDGFNLYYGVIARNRLHWLDLQEFARRMNDGIAVDRIVYCTAMVSSTAADPEKSQRQVIYHRALAMACPKADILLGNFSTHQRFQPIAKCGSDPTCIVRVSVRTEKGSDVNLASHLLHDAHMGRFDRAIVVSGDSDLVEPIRLIVQELRKIVIVRNPRDRDSMELKAVASRYLRVTRDVLEASQLPQVVSDGVKECRKPDRWSQTFPSTPRVNLLTSKCPQNGCSNTITTCRYQSDAPTH